MLQIFANLIYPADYVFILYFGSVRGFSCNLVRILDCDFIVELLADLDNTIVVPPPPPPIRGDFNIGILHGRKITIYAAPGQLEQRYSELFDYYFLTQRCLTPATVNNILDLPRLVPSKNLTGIKKDNSLKLIN